MHSSARDGLGFEASNEALRQICGPYQVSCDRWWAFEGSIRARRIGSLELADISLSACRVMRDHRDEHYRGDQYFLIFQAEGFARMRQRGSEALLRPGDCTLIDSRYPSVFEAPHGFRQYSFHVPAPLFNERCARRAVPVAQTIRSDRGAGNVLSDLLRSLVRNAASLEGVELTNTVVHMLSTALGTGDRNCVEATALDRRTMSSKEIEHYIEAHIQSAELSPQSIAGHFNISVRQLYRIVASAACTPSALIWKARLRHARELLAQRGSRTPIIEVALSCGFKDGAHFSRAYRKAFGCPPKVSRGIDAAVVRGSVAPRESSVAPLT